MGKVSLKRVRKTSTFTTSLPFFSQQCCVPFLILSDNKS